MNWAAHLLGIAANRRPLAQVLLFERCEHLTARQWHAWLATRAGRGPGRRRRASKPMSTRPQFTRRIERIRDYIAAGDTYQVNYTYRLRFDAFGSLFALYRACARASRCPTARWSACPTAAPCCRCRPNCSCAMRGRAAGAPDEGHGAGQRDETTRAAPPRSRSTRRTAPKT
jgi:para-aminobenzoate synthetase/4-amino-4-deoxychorismate lyase